MRVHGSCASHDDHAVLLLGPPGAGKSDLVLRLLRRGWHLVADDQVTFTPHLLAAPPPALAGLLEVRGLGILEGLPTAGPTPLRLVVHLAPRDAIPRLPAPATWHGLPAVTLHAFDASTPLKVELALDAALGRVRQRAGAFAA